MKYLFYVAVMTLLNLKTYAIDEAGTPTEGVDYIKVEAAADELAEMSPRELLQLEVTQSELPLEFD